MFSSFFPKYIYILPYSEPFLHFLLVRSRSQVVLVVYSDIQQTSSNQSFVSFRLYPAMQNNKIPMTTATSS